MKKREVIKANTTPLENLLNAGFSRSDIAAAIGVSESSLSPWLQTKIMPKVAHMACEGLLRRHSKLAVKSHLYLVAVPNADVSMFTSIVDRMGFKVSKVEAE